MIYILASDLEDARQWCAFNGVRRRDSVYLGSPSAAEGRRLYATDRVVRTARSGQHPALAEIEDVLRRDMAKSGLVEVDGGSRLAAAL